MDFLFEFLFELLADILEGIIESDRVPKWIRYSLLGLLCACLLALILLAVIHSTTPALTIFLCVLGAGLVALFAFLAYRIYRSGVLRPAKKEDLPEILKMYRSVIGKPGCHWTISYPNEATLYEDFRNNNLYVLWQGKHRLGAGSVVTRNELDDLPCWQYRENVREIARIVIAPQYQGKGYGKHLVRKLCGKLDHGDANAVHILVSAQNNHAKNLYRECCFACRGECHRYDHDYFAYERKL